jgi:hypothetical protein
MIKLHIQQINEELARFNSAANMFRPYSQGFINNTRNKLEGFNSDFIDKMKKLLENMTDTGAPKLLEKADMLYRTTKGAVDSFEEVDKTLARMLDEGK